MHIVLRDESRRLIGRIDVNESLRPTRVPISEAPIGVLRSLLGSPLSAISTSRQPIADSRPPAATPSREVFLNWETALDDAGQLRRCIACGCTDLFIEKAFPMVTGAVVALAFIGAAMGAVGLAEAPPVLIGMAVVLVLDVAILIFSRRRLVCYRCRSTYRDLPIASYHRPWDRSLADHHPAAAPAKVPPPGQTPADFAPPDDVVLPAVIRTAPAAAGEGADNKDYFA
jgi:hypothetical protein